MVAQDPILYEGTIRDNIVYGCDWATEEDVLNAAKIANAHNFVMETEKQYDTNCGEKGIQLSGNLLGNDILSRWDILENEGCGSYSDSLIYTLLYIGKEI